MGWTSAWAVQDALVAGLAAADGLTGWGVSFGQPARMADRLVWVGEAAARWTHDTDTTGPGCGETLQVPVVVWCRRTGGTALEVRDEVAGAAETVAAVVAADRTLGGACVWSQIVGAEYEGGPGDDAGRSREAALVLRVAVTAWVGV